jgi:hypothetical protein
MDETHFGQLFVWKWAVPEGRDVEAVEMRCLEESPTALALVGLTAELRE